MWLPKGSYGTQTAAIKKYTDHSQPCKSCKAFDRSVTVYQDYYHFLFLPFVALPGKTAKVRCNSCGEPVLTRSVLEEYENKTKTPFYLYSEIILIVTLILWAVIAGNVRQNKKENLAAHPQVGDVYTIKNPATASYHFLKLVQIKGDTIIAYQNNFIYYHDVSSLEEKNDFFDTSDTFKLTKNSIQQMLDDDKIDAVYRDYDESKGFNRIN